MTFPPGGGETSAPSLALSPGTDPSGGILRCPHCHAELHRLERLYRCANGHSFDIARQGYVNLLPAARRHSPDPGDNREMVLSRRRFLDGGYFAALADEINATVRAALGEAPTARRILDAGAGEGYYLAHLQRGLTERTVAATPDLYGVDVSRHAVQYATHRSKAVTWLVASIVDLPLLNASLDVVLSVFAPLAPLEFQRVLRHSGLLIVVGPAPRHLLSLRQLLYPAVLPHRADQMLADLAPHFTLRGNVELTYAIELPTAELISDLLTMTPFGWNIDAARRANAEARAPLSTTVAACIRVFEPTIRQ